MFPSNPKAVHGQENDAARLDLSSVLCILLLCVPMSGCVEAPPSNVVIRQPQSAAIAGRTTLELQSAFVRRKADFYRIFSGYAANGSIDAGKIVLSITVSPDGTVSECHLVSSTFSNADLGSAIVARARQLTFAARDVPEFTYPNYPINYVPQ